MHFLSIWAAGLTLTQGIAYAATQLSFFEHNSCNAGTSFEKYTDYSVLTADTSCHQLPNETVAFYVNQIDEGCSIRTYLSSNCDPSSSSLAGVLISVGTCFYVDEGVDLGSWRPDCPGVDYGTTNGLDTSNSYSASSESSNSNSGSSNTGGNSTITTTATSTVAPTNSGADDADPAAQSVIKTATGPVTFTPTTTSTTSASASASASSSGSGSDVTSAAASANAGTRTGTGSASTTGTAKTSSGTSTNGAAGWSSSTRPLMASFGTVMATFALLGFIQF